MKKVLKRFLLIPFFLLFLFFTSKAFGSTPKATGCGELSQIYSQFQAQSFPGPGYFSFWFSYSIPGHSAKAARIETVINGVRKVKDIVLSGSDTWGVEPFLIPSGSQVTITVTLFASPHPGVGGICYVSTDTPLIPT